MPWLSVVLTWTLEGSEEKSAHIPAVINQPDVPPAHLENPFVLPPLDFVACTLNLEPLSLPSVMSNDGLTAMAKPFHQDFFRKTRHPSLCLVFYFLSTNINTLVNSQSILAIAIKRSQLIIKKQAGLGIQFNMPSMLQIHSSLTESRGQCLETKHIFMKPNIVKHEQKKPYITRARKMNWHAESIVSHLLNWTNTALHKTSPDSWPGQEACDPRLHAFKFLNEKGWEEGIWTWTRKGNKTVHLRIKARGWLGASKEEEKH